ncbi:MAG: DUF4307 domain-containing protein [Actinobacteria bacterium]|nr:DUF4307 domain-containing protein [Actinomycetota bacterium]
MVMGLAMQPELLKSKFAWLKYVALKVMSTESDLLASRYGKTATSSKVTRQRIIAVASVLVAVFLGWAIWVTVSGVNEIKHQVLGYQVLSEGQTSVKFSVQSPAGAAKCAIQVLNQGFAVVGYKEVAVPASGQYETFVNTTELGVTGLVDKCWLK